MVALRLRFTCAGCGSRVDAGALDADARCMACGRVRPPVASEALRARGILDRCAVCGDARLYRQKDLNRKLGLAVVVTGAIASLALLPWSVLGAYGVLGALALLDLALYRRLPEVAICYRCHAEHRGYAPQSPIEPFDLLTLELVDHQKAALDRGGGNAGGRGAGVPPAG
jgi:hypothetical protein